MIWLVRPALCPFPSIISFFDLGVDFILFYLPLAIVAHEGAAANEGHYTTLVRKATFSKSPFAMEDNKRWYKFDDDIVSVLKGSKLSELNGGGMFA